MVGAKLDNSEGALDSPVGKAVGAIVTYSTVGMKVYVSEGVEVG